MGTTSDSFYLFGYSLILSPFIAWFGLNGVTALQASIYALTIWLAWTLLNRAKVTPTLVVVGTAVIAYHPYLLLNIQRVNDNVINVFLIIILYYYLFTSRVLHDFSRSVGSGIALGLFCIIRPNAAVFALLPIVALLMDHPTRQKGYRLAALYGSAIAVWFAVSFVATGTPFFVPSNGPYNLFAGNNPYSEEALLSMFNGEYSIDRGLEYFGYAGVDRYTIDGQTYIRLSMEFIKSQPAEAFKLLFIKAWVLLGPDLSHADNTAEIVIQTALAMPVLVWLALLWLTRGLVSRSETLYILLFFILFIGPFIATNADPRIRLPLDVMLLVDSVKRLDLYWRSRRTEFR